MSTLKIFFIFLKMGSLAFGGGAMGLPLMKSEFTEKYAVLTEDEFLDLLVFSQSISGVMLVNLSALIGYRLKRGKGMVSAIVGIMLPPVMVITLIASFFVAFMSIQIIRYIFQGLNIAIVVLILKFVWDMIHNKVRDSFIVLIYFSVLVCYMVIGCNPVIFIVVSAVLGFIFAKRRTHHE